MPRPSRRELLRTSALGFGWLALADMLSRAQGADAPRSGRHDPLAPKAPHFAAKGDDAARVREAYRRCFARAPSAAELDKVLAYLQKSEEAADPKLAEDERRLRAWRGLCRVLLASNEFVFVE